MRKSLSGFLVLFLLTVVLITLSGCNKSGGKTKRPTGGIDISEAKLISDTTLNVGANCAYPPFESYADDGYTPLGFDIDIITEVAKRLGLKVNIIDTSFDGIFMAMGVNYDVVCSGVTVTPERKRAMLFSTPYIKNYQAVVVREDSRLKINSLMDLSGLTVGVQKDTTSDILLSDFKSTDTADIQIVANEMLASSFTQLKNGEIDAVCADSTVAAGFLAKYPDDYKIVYRDESEVEEFAIALPMGNEALKRAIDEALNQMSAEGFIDETYEFWFGKDE